MPPEDKPVTIIFPDSSTASKVVDFIVRKRPVGWGRRSYSTYYNERYALWIKKDIDQMVIDRQPRVYRYESFSCSSQSLYVRVYQAMRYLMEQMDSDGKYKKILSDIKLKRVRSLGITLKYDDVLEGEQRAEVFIEDTLLPKWKKDLDNYLEDSSLDKPFHKDGLLLTPAQVEQLNLELGGLSNVIFSVTSREIKVVKGG
jgi:hypothetical protein